MGSICIRIPHYMYILSVNWRHITDLVSAKGKTKEVYCCDRPYSYFDRSILMFLMREGLQSRISILKHCLLRLWIDINQLTFVSPLTKLSQLTSIDRENVTVGIVVRVLSPLFDQSGTVCCVQITARLSTSSPTVRVPTTSFWCRQLATGAWRSVAAAPGARRTWPAARRTSCGTCIAAALDALTARSTSLIQFCITSIRAPVTTPRTCKPSTPAS